MEGDNLLPFVLIQPDFFLMLCLMVGLPFTQSVLRALLLLLDVDGFLLSKLLLNVS